MPEPYMVALLRLEHHETTLNKRQVSEIVAADRSTLIRWVKEADPEDTACLIKTLADYVILSQMIRNHLPETA